MQFNVEWLRQWVAIDPDAERLAARLTAALLTAARPLPLVGAGAGAQVVLASTPHYFRSQMTAEALVAHFTALADGSPAPVLLYNVPSRTAVDLQPETVERLATEVRPQLEAYLAS